MVSKIAVSIWSYSNKRGYSQFTPIFPIILACHAMNPYYILLYTEKNGVFRSIHFFKCKHFYHQWNGATWLIFPPIVWGRQLWWLPDHFPVHHTPFWKRCLLYKEILFIWNTNLPGRYILGAVSSPAWVSITVKATLIGWGWARWGGGCAIQTNKKKKKTSDKQWSLCTCAVKSRVFRADA